LAGCFAAQFSQTSEKLRWLKTCRQRFRIKQIGVLRNDARSFGGMRESNDKQVIRVSTGYVGTIVIGEGHA